MRRRAKPSKPKVEAKAPVARKARKHEGSRVHDLEKRLAEALKREAEAQKREAEALEQQMATAEILRVISSSPTDVQPVFDTIARSAARLCDGLYGTAHRFDGELVHLTAHHNCAPEVLLALRQAFPMRPDRKMMSGRAILTRAVVHVEDVLADPEYAQHVGRAGGFRGVLAVPMVRDGSPIGAIVVIRGQPGPFSAGQIELLKTFADQAVIAIENVRLFKELEARTGDLTEALEQQTASSEILRVISSSPTDLQPVLDTIATTAAQLCDAHNGAIFRFDGEVFRPAAKYNVSTELQQKNEALTQAHAQVSEALEQQTATSDILRVISSSPTDVQPVFDAIAKNARRLLHGHTVAVTRLVGKELQLMSYSTTSPAADAVMRAFHPLPVERVPTAARAVHERTPAVVSDIETDPTATEEQREVGRARGFRSFVYMPMVRDDVTIGVIAVTR